MSLFDPQDEPEDDLLDEYEPIPYEEGYEFYDDEMVWED